MNLKWINRIFGKQPGLSRKDVSNYANSSDKKLRHRIELKESSSSFDADAMEGWEAMGYDMSKMKRLDQSFQASSNVGWYFGVGGIIIAAVIIAVILIPNETSTNLASGANDTTEKITSLLDEQKVTLEQTDIILPDSINALNDAPIEKRIEPLVIQEEFKQMKNTYQDQPLPKIEMIPLDEMRISERLREQKLIRDHSKAKEIYLYNLKLVDYRSYRSKPTVKTKQVVLTGTPASKEGESSTDPISELQEIEIPYVEYLSKTMRKFSKGSYKSALSRFDIILSTYESDVNANFYSGLCLFNLEEYETAIDRFLKCRTGQFSNFDEEAQWMTALSYEKLGKHQEANQYFQKIVDQGGFYKKRAQAKMK
jgi:TolA-binding protein